MDELHDVSALKILYHARYMMHTDGFRYTIGTTSCAIWRMYQSVAHVSRFLTIWHSRFGGGSELLRDGDREHVWAVIERGMV